ncbi:MAG: DUF167 domain-containing protein [Microthrixaceae bacterium]|nr:DUF167 domain-containing protein [Microthrixaceae bacterium]
MSEAVWAQQTDRGWVLRIRVQPSAGRSKVVGEHGGALKVRVAAPANEGKANAELVRFLAKHLGVSRSSVELVSGERSRDKAVAVRCDGEVIQQFVADVRGGPDR